jgi:hypothetical protein
MPSIYHFYCNVLKSFPYKYIIGVAKFSFPLASKMIKIPRKKKKRKRQFRKKKIKKKHKKNSK